jgi:hypothetical protein
MAITSFFPFEWLDLVACSVARLMDHSTMSAAQHESLCHLASIYVPLECAVSLYNIACVVSGFSNVSSPRALCILMCT